MEKASAGDEHQLGSEALENGLYALREEKRQKLLLVLSEKKHREVIIRKPRSAKAESVVKALDRLERKLGAEAFRECCKSITMDNGPEFSDWRSLVRSRVTGKRQASAYYCHPYSAWECGTVGQAIGMIRCFIPKGSDIGKLSGTDIQGIGYRLNDLPRHVLNRKNAKNASAGPSPLIPKAYLQGECFTYCCNWGF
jgi:IS30 family transposase